MKQLIEGCRIALAALRANKLRTFLTLLGNIVGTMAVITVVSLLDGIDRYAREEIAAEGSNVVTISRLDLFEVLTDFDEFVKAFRRNPQLEWSDYQFLGERLTGDPVVDVVARRSESVYAGDRAIHEILIEGRTETVTLIENIRIASGRPISPLEVSRRKSVVVVGSDVAKNLFPGADPVGRTVKIRGRHFRIVGVAEARTSQLGNNRNRFVTLPFPAYRKSFGEDELEIKVMARSPGAVPDLMEEITHSMRLRHRLKPTEEDDFAVTSSDRILGIWENISKAVFRSLVGLASISLVVGGVVLMNVMLVAVTERTKEIGLRKALGASRMDIVMQFVAESVTLSVIGGVLGVSLGFAIAGAVSAFSPLPSAIQPWSVAAGLAVTFLIGVVFGTFPANRAAMLDPVEALRHE